jgi:DNA polymerase-3 subunit beta
MKLSIAKHELQRGLARIQAVVEKRNTMPILANVHLAAVGEEDSGQLELAATDLEVGIRSSHPAEISDAGSVTVSAKKFYEIVRELPEEPVRIEVSPNAYLSIHCARADFTLAGNLPDEYPTLPSATPGQITTVQALVLAQMIERTIYAASADETRYNLNGVYFERLPETGVLRMVATDGHRLAYVDRDLGVPSEGLEQGVIIPRKALIELKRLLDEEDADEVEIGFEGNNGLVRKQGVTLVMRLIEGEFPNYRQVIPKELSHQLTLPIEPLRQVLRRVALLSSERSRAVKLQLTAGLLRLSSSNPDLGEAQEDLDVDYAGKELTIAFNARYLLDCLGVLTAKEVKLSLQDEHSPAQLVPTDDEDTLAVVMPMRI